MPNWKGEGAPGELRDSKGKVETRMKEVARIYHKAIEEKVMMIVKEMEKYDEKEKDEEEEKEEEG